MRRQQPFHIRAGELDATERIATLLDVRLDYLAFSQELLPLLVNLRLHAPGHPLRRPVGFSPLTVVGDRALRLAYLLAHRRRSSPAHRFPETTRGAAIWLVGGGLVGT
jgi:hypothetical protein